MAPARLKTAGFEVSCSVAKEMFFQRRWDALCAAEVLFIDCRRRGGVCGVVGVVRVKPIAGRSDFKAVIRREERIVSSQSYDAASTHSVSDVWSREWYRNCGSMSLCALRLMRGALVTLLMTFSWLFPQLFSTNLIMRVWQVEADA